MKQKYGSQVILWYGQVGDKMMIHIYGPQFLAKSANEHLRFILSNELLIKFRSIKTPSNALVEAIKLYLPRVYREVNDALAPGSNNFSDPDFTSQQGQDSSSSDDENDDAESIGNILPKISYKITKNSTFEFAFNVVSHIDNEEIMTDVMKRLNAFIDTFATVSQKVPPPVFETLKDELDQLDCNITDRKGIIFIEGSRLEVEKAGHLLTSVSTKVTKYVSIINDSDKVKYLRFIHSTDLKACAKNIQHAFGDHIKVNVHLKPTGQNKLAIFRIAAPQDQVSAVVKLAENELQKMSSRIFVERLLMTNKNEYLYIRRNKSLLKQIEKNDKVMLFDSCPYNAKHSHIHLRAYLRSQHRPEILVEVKNATVDKIYADVLVNAANEHLSHNGGIALAISKLAGEQFDKDSLDSVFKEGLVPTGTSRLLPSRYLQKKNDVKFVAHTVAPNFAKQTISLSAFISSAARDAIDKSNSKATVTSIAIPLIGSGIYGWDSTTCAEQIVKAVTSAYQTGMMSNIRHVILFDMDKSKVNAIAQAIESATKRCTPTAYENASGSLQDSNIQGSPALPKLEYVWSWEKSGNFILYDYDQQIQIEQAFRQKKKSVRIMGDVSGVPSDSKHIPPDSKYPEYTVDFGEMIQFNVVSRYRRRVRREKFKPGDPFPALYEQRLSEFNAMQQATTKLNLSVTTQQDFQLHILPHSDELSFLFMVLKKTFLKSRNYLFALHKTFGKKLKLYFLTRVCLI